MTHKISPLLPLPHFAYPFEAFLWFIHLVLICRYAPLSQLHLQEDCECRDVQCPKCGNRGVTEQIMRQQWREDCTMLEVRCGYGCGASIARKHSDHHMAMQVHMRHR